MERDRNRLLKEAELTVGQSAMVLFQGASVVALAGAQEPPQPEGNLRRVAQSTAITSYHMNSGHFVGQDPRILTERAIEWWGEQLEKIEHDACVA
jgi:hypothetical protein